MSARRLSREDWIHAALDAIAGGGLGAVAIEPLAATLGVTKGSFYAHFSGREELIDATLAAWEESHATGALPQVRSIADPAARLAEVIRAAVAFSQGGEPSVHLNLLGEMHDLRVREAVARVTAGRLRELTAMFGALGLDPSVARRRARMLYATYLGLLQMARESPERPLGAAETRRLVEDLRRALITAD